MLKKLSENIGTIVKSEAVLIGKTSNIALQTIGLENTGQFVEEQLIDIGEDTSSSIEITGQAVEGTVKTAGGLITQNEELKQSGFEDINEVKDRFINDKVKTVREKVEDVSKIGNGLLTGDVRQAKDGVTELIGFKKSAVGLNIIDDLTQYKKD